MEITVSLVLNILLLLAVLFSITRLIKGRRASLYKAPQTVIDEPRIEQDEIISIRKINMEPPPVASLENTEIANPAEASNEPSTEKIRKESQPQTLMMFLLARENRQFAGYELLQTILASGLRFGEGQLFHRHQFAHGQGPILCSLAAATESGLFDLQNIGAFSVRGLCLYMEASGNGRIDEERFTIMLDTARQLAEGLDALLLDDMRRPLTDQRINRYYQLLNLQGAYEPV
jgi:cell division protein ZipA